VGGDFAISEDAAHRTANGLREHLERSAIERFFSLMTRPTAAIEGDFAREDAAHRTSEDLRKHPERHAVDVHELSLFSRDAKRAQHELVRLAANLRAIQRDAYLTNQYPISLQFHPARGTHARTTPSKVAGKWLASASLRCGQTNLAKKRNRATQS
jgi:hypothetical protein